MHTNMNDMTSDINKLLQKGLYCIGAGISIIALGITDASKIFGKRGAQLKYHFHDNFVIKP